MKVKRFRFLAFLMACILILSAVPAMAAEQPFNAIENGDFEEIAPDGLPQSWGFGTVRLGVNGEITDKGYQNSKAARIYSADESLGISQAVYGLIPGNTYKLSMQVNAPKKGGLIKMEIWSNPVPKREHAGAEQLTIGTTKGWEEKTIEFTAPENAYYLTLALRIVNGGDVTFDNVTFTGELDEANTAAILAKKQEMVINGSFEEQDSASDAPKEWGLNGGAWGTNSFYTNEARTGNKAVRFTSEDTKIYVAQKVYGVVPGAKYTAGGWIKNMKEDSNAGMLKLEFWANPEIEKKSVGSAQVSAKNAPVGEWQKFTISGTIPEECYYASFMVRLVAAGDVIWDDITFYSEFNPDGVPQPPYQDPVPVKDYTYMSENLFQNPGFEELDADGKAVAWDYYSQDHISVSDTVAFAGNNSLKISTTNGKNPWGCQMVYGLEPGAKYVIRGKLRADDSNACCFKLEFYAADEGKKDSTGNSTSEFAGYTNGEWIDFAHEFDVPPRTKGTACYIRLRSSTGTIYYDEVGLYKIGYEDKFKLLTDDVFYYTDDHGYGTATVFPLERYGAEYGNSGYAVFKFLDGNTVLSEATVPMKNSEAIFKYDLDLIREKQRAYQISMQMFSDDGVLIQEKLQNIYKYDRPTSMDKDGNFYVDGKLFEPVFAYHVNQGHYEQCLEAGINVVQGENFNSAKAYLDFLDKAHAVGMKVMVPFYGGMKPAGHPHKAENTKKIVAEIKDHPAIFAYMIMDEPYFNFTDPEPYMENSYKIIRDIDPVHPIYTMENRNYLQGYRYCDIFGVDIYQSKSPNPQSVIADYMRQIQLSSSYKKPVWALLQTFYYGDKFPTGDELRSTIYQAYFEGAKAVGYYTIRTAGQNKEHLVDMDIWSTVKDFGGEENKLLQSMMSRGEYPGFRDEKTDKYWYRSFVKDGKVIVSFLNFSGTEEVTAEVKLTSGCGNVSLGSVTAKALYGAEGTASGTDTLKISLKPSAAETWEITPDGAVDFSTLVYSPFVDFVKSTVDIEALANNTKKVVAPDFRNLGNDYTWARNAVDTLYAKGIVNSESAISYAPGRRITRGDFAMYLVRTLGLTADTTENFTDVKPEMEYAKELAIGKACGILQGVGDNKYNPEAFITRQDMMTIISRGMQLSGEGADISAFSDAGLIADYAVDHVKAMVKSGLVKGNADGTMNPLGNTTRAEAAVIMQRIIEMA